MNYSKKLMLIIALNFVGFLNCSESEDIKYLFAHGFGGNRRQMEYYQRYGIIPNDQAATAFNGPEAYDRMEMGPKLAETVFAQDGDVQVLTNAMQGNQTRVIGVGVSKGAATWINTVAQAQNINKVRALVLESPFASANEMIYKATCLHYIPGHEYIAKIIGKFFLPKYNFGGIQPINAIARIANKNLPIFIIHSKKDSLIHINHSRRLYVEFLKNGFTNVHLIETQEGWHANILGGKDTVLFQRAVSEFNFAHNLLNADVNNGYQVIQNGKPSIEEVTKMIKHDHNYKPEISRFIIKTLLSCYVVYKVFKYFPGVGTALNNYMFKLMQLLKTQIIR